MDLVHLFVLLLGAIHVQAVRHYEIINNCPLSINLYINGESQGALASNGGTTTRDFPNSWSGFIYTDFNRGNWDGGGTVRAGFYGPSDYYYLVKDPNWFNVGVSVNPINRAPKGGYCFNIACEYEACPQFYSNPPMGFPPAQSGVPPNVPLYACPVVDTGYRVIFCPSGTLPNYNPRADIIQPFKSTAKCLEVRGEVYANGTPVQINDCNGSVAQKWVIRRGQNQVKAGGISYCLDAGSRPANGVKLKIWKCYDNLPAQQWYYTSDSRIQLYGQGLCVDLTDGDLSNGNQVQLWQCSEGNANQIWNW